MPKLAKPWTKAVVNAQKVSQSSGLPVAQKQLRARKGKSIPLAILYSGKFRQGLQDMILRMKVDFTNLGPIRSVKELFEVLTEARKRLRKKGINAITVEAWLGEAWEVTVERYPEIRDFQIWAGKMYVGEVNTVLSEILSREKSPFVTLSGHFKKVNVRKPFKKQVRIYDVRIREQRQETGAQAFDNGLMAYNGDRQGLPMPTEIKTRGAGKALAAQMADLDDRLRNSPPGTKLTFYIEGEEGIKELDLKDLILVRDKNNFTRSLGVDFFRRIGVIAGTKERITVARDKGGNPYFRVKLSFSTDLLRRIIERVHRDPRLLQDSG